MNKLLLLLSVFSFAIFTSCGETKTAEEANEKLEEVKEDAMDQAADIYEAFANQIKADFETVENKLNRLKDDVSAEAEAKKAKLEEIKAGLNKVNEQMMSADQAIKDEAGKKHEELKQMLNEI